MNIDRQPHPTRWIPQSTPLSVDEGDHASAAINLCVYHSALKLGRTIVKLVGSDDITKVRLAEGK